MKKSVDNREVAEILFCESRCDSEDSSCPEHCELMELPEN
jgi:hypothetical protein